jgi:sugar phosphate isomerase/epimerase
MEQSRRAFFKTAALGLTAGAVFNKNVFGKDQPQTPTPDRLKLGIASFTFKEYSLEQAIAMTQRVGIQHIALKSFHLPLESSREQIIAAANKVRSAGLNLYGCSVVVLKNESEVNQVFEYAKAAQMDMIIAQPVNELMGLLEKKVKDYNIKLAIHNHGPEDPNYPSPYETYEKVKKMDSRMGLCIDIGHVRRSGFDPSECIRKCADRLMDVHIKDLRTIQTVADVCEVGRGKLDIPEVLRTLLKIKFSGVVAFEYEKDLNDPLAGLAESIGFTRGVLKVI